MVQQSVWPEVGGAVGVGVGGRQPCALMIRSPRTCRGTVEGGRAVSAWPYLRCYQSLLTNLVHFARHKGPEMDQALKILLCLIHAFCY